MTESATDRLQVEIDRLVAEREELYRRNEVYPSGTEEQVRADIEDIDARITKLRDQSRVPAQ